MPSKDVEEFVFAGKSVSLRAHPNEFIESRKPEEAIFKLLGLHNAMPHTKRLDS